SSILAAMNDYVAHHHEQGLPNSITSENLNSIFKNHLPDVISSISRYAHQPEEKVKLYLSNTYNRIRQVIEDKIGQNPHDVQNAFKQQQEEMLSYLPAS